jgi:hypothetical protein
LDLLALFAVASLSLALRMVLEHKKGDPNRRRRVDAGTFGNAGNWHSFPAASKEGTS